MVFNNMVAEHVVRGAYYQWLTWTGDGVALAVAFVVPLLVTVAFGEEKLLATGDGVIFPTHTKNGNNRRISHSE